MHRFSLTNNGVILHLGFNGVFKDLSDFTGYTAIVNENHGSNRNRIGKSLVRSSELHVISFHSVIRDNSEGLSSLEVHGLLVSEVS